MVFAEGQGKIMSLILVTRHKRLPQHQKLNKVKLITLNSIYIDKYTVYIIILPVQIMNYQHIKIFV